MVREVKGIAKMSMLGTGLVMMMMMTFITRRGEGQGRTKKGRKAKSAWFGGTIFSFRASSLKTGQRVWKRSACLTTGRTPPRLGWQTWRGR